MVVYGLVKMVHSAGGCTGSALLCSDILTQEGREALLEQLVDKELFHAAVRHSRKPKYARQRLLSTPLHFIALDVQVLGCNKNDSATRFAL